jgi:hypothetical protein
MWFYRGILATAEIVPPRANPLENHPISPLRVRWQPTRDIVDCGGLRHRP